MNVAIFRTDAAPINGRPCNLVLVCDALSGDMITLATECAHPNGHLDYLHPTTGTWIAGSLNVLIIGTLNGTIWKPSH